MKKRQKRMRQQLIVHFVLVAVLSLTLFSGYYVTYMRHSIERETIEKSERVLSHALEKIELLAGQVNEFANYICRNQSVQTLLQGHREDAKLFSPDKQSVINELNRQFQHLPLTEHILSLFIIGNNGLDIRSGKESSLVDYAEVVSTFCQRERFSNMERIHWDALRRNPTALSGYGTVLPYSQRIVSANGAETLGYLVIIFKPGLFSDQCPEFLGKPGERIALISSGGDVLGANDAWRGNNTLKTYESRSVLLQNDLHNGHPVTVDGQRLVFYGDATAAPVWTLVAAVPDGRKAEQLLLLLRTGAPVLLVAIALACGLAIYFSRRFTQPITEMVSAVSDIARGNFERKIEPGTAYELTQLGHSINEMQDEIKMLIEERIRQEKDKRNTEMRMLKAQINPHFLGNTLNSIRMMAKMQGARGICNMTEALGELLHANLRDATETISLRDELSMLSKYIYIQNVRYKGMIEYETHVAEDDLYDFHILRFILQPLVENAIQHGIEPGRLGEKITVSAWRKDAFLYLCVQDNGCGMSAQKLEMLQRGEASQGGGIGVQNVHRRLRTTYGEQSGLRFESSPGQGTKVTAVLYFGNDKGA